MASETNKEHFWRGLAKILEEQWQVDVRLKPGNSNDEGPFIFAHKLILASRSEVFKKMLESDELKTSVEKVETVILPEMKQVELEALVEFMYSENSTLSAKAKQNVKSLYVAADKYMILHLRELCRNELISSLSSTNALDFLKLAQIPFDEVLNEAAFGCVKKDISTIANSERFKEFVASNPNLAMEIMKASLTSAGKSNHTSGDYCRRCGILRSHDYDYNYYDSPIRDYDACSI